MADSAREYAGYTDAAPNMADSAREYAGYTDAAPNMADSAREYAGYTDAAPNMADSASSHRPSASVAVDIPSWGGVIFAFRPLGAYREFA
jgi:hypothetical protein